MVANDSRALGDSKLVNKNAPTNFTVNPRYESRILKNFGDDLLYAMENENILFHAHMHGIPVKFYHDFPSLNDFFKIISVNLIDG